MTQAEDALCRELRDAITAAFGQEAADKTRIDYDKGWYYYNPARQTQDGEFGQWGMAKGMRRRQVVEEIERIRKIAEQERSDA
jgi:hypothetical protein